MKSNFQVFHTGWFLMPRKVATFFLDQGVSFKGELSFLILIKEINRVFTGILKTDFRVKSKNTYLLRYFDPQNFEARVKENSISKQTFNKNVKLRFRPWWRSSSRQLRRNTTLRTKLKGRTTDLFGFSKSTVFRWKDYHGKLVKESCVRSMELRLRTWCMKSS